MHELVRSNFHTRLTNSLRVPSLAGNGLPERMRSTAFAFLGLTAAAGLALVAIFAQLNFPLLSPSPLPSEPVEANAVAEAVALDHGPESVPVRPSRYGAGGAATGSTDRGPAGDDGGSVAPESPSSAPPSGGGVAPGSAGAPAPDPTPASTPAAGSPPASEAPAPAPSKPEPAPARPAAPESAPAPGNSQSSAAAAHASERGVEASSKSSAIASPETSAAPSPETAPGNGNGKALGHYK